MVLQKRNVFLYWTGLEYKLIIILRNLIYLHSKNGIGYNVILITPKNINAIVQIYELDLNEYVFKKSALVNIPTMKKEAMINLNE